MVMFKVTRFCVVPWERRGERLVRGEARQFLTLAEAEAAQRQLRRRRERVDLYEVTGWPVQDLWDRPRLVSRAGVLPRLQAGQHAHDRERDA